MVYDIQTDLLSKYLLIVMMALLSHVKLFVFCVYFFGGLPEPQKYPNALLYLFIDIYFWFGMYYLVFGSGLLFWDHRVEETKCSFCQPHMKSFLFYFCGFWIVEYNFCVLYLIF